MLYRRWILLRDCRAAGKTHPSGKHTLKVSRMGSNSSRICAVWQSSTICTRTAKLAVSPVLSCSFDWGVSSSSSPLSTLPVKLNKVIRRAPFGPKRKLQIVVIGASRMSEDDTSGCEIVLKNGKVISVNMVLASVSSSARRSTRPFIIWMPGSVASFMMRA